MRKQLLSFSFSLAVLIASAVNAVEYELIKGKGIEVCEVCLENLRRQSVEGAVCDRQYAADLGLSVPEWNPLDLQEHAEFYKRVINFINEGNEHAKNPNLDDPKNLQAAIKFDRLALSRANVDNDGTPEHLLRWSHGTCLNMFRGFFYLYASALLVLTDDQRAIDRAKTESLALSSFKEPKHPLGMTNYQLYQVFAYKGIIYFDKWDGGGGSKQARADTNTLSVYRVLKGKTEKVCQIRLFPVEVEPHN